MKGTTLSLAQRFAQVVSLTCSVALLVIGLAFVVVMRRGIAAVTDPANVGASGAATLLAAAAQDIEAATAVGGTGITFDAIQRTTEYTKAGGSPIPVIDPTDQTKVVATTDQLYINGMMTRGAWTTDGFWMEMRLAPPPSQTADFATAPRMFGVIQKAGKLWRDDGAGWYETTQSPGMGIDPVSARRLPQVLRKLTSITALGTKVVDGTILIGYKGTASIDDYPGVVAADGHDFSDGTFAFEVWFNPANKLARIVVRARNLNEHAYDLQSETVITIHRDQPASIPDPLPPMPPESPPSPDPAAPASTETGR